MSSHHSQIPKGFFPPTPTLHHLFLGEQNPKEQKYFERMFLDVARHKGEAVFGSLGRKSLLVYLHKSDESLPDNQKQCVKVEGRKE